MRLHLAVTFVFAVVAVSSFSLGCILIYRSSNWYVDYYYHVSIVAPDEATWTLGLPKPLKEMSVSATGLNVSISDFQTPYGEMHLVAGRGTAGIDQSSHESIYAPENGQDFSAESLGLSGWNASGYWVFRWSDHPGSVIHVGGTSWWVATQMSDKTSCGGPGFNDDVVEGWSVAKLMTGDCVRGIGTPSRLNILTVAFSLSGAAAVAAIATRLIWGRRTRGRRPENGPNSP